MKTKEMVGKYETLLGALLSTEERQHLKFLVRTPNSQGKYLEVGFTEKFYDKEKDETYENQVNWSAGDYKVVTGHSDIASFKLYQMPHCCGILVSCEAYVALPFRNKRIGTLMNNLRQDIGRALGYSLMMCTDIETNTNQRKLLKTNNWRDLTSFINRRTKNTVIVSCISL